MYYLKYRPQVVADIANRERRELLAGIIADRSRVPHAFLLVGPKGTGKTSTARIIAKALNCLSPAKNGEPCNQCANCLAISANRFLDVFELDGASNRGIDDVRAIREQVVFAPSAGKYKVYIIDEVHMLTKEAFNALLKTLEEPPQYVVFILATTEAHKLPDTVISRCVRLNFQKGTVEELTATLERINAGEKLQADKQVLTRVAAAANGSFRDAAKLLELAASSTDLSLKAVEKILNHNAAHDEQELYRLLLAKNLDQAAKWINQFEQQGGDFASLIEKLLNLTQLQMLVDRGLVENKELSKSQAQLKDLTRLSKTLLEAYRLGKFSPVESIPLLVGTVEYCLNG